MHALTRTDERLQTLIGERAARRIHDVEITDPTQGIVEPHGMSLADEEELEILLELADPADSGDEQAAIERLITILEEVAV